MLRVLETTREGLSGRPGRGRERGAGMSNPEAALASLYGGKALAGNVGGQEREQEVWTPDWILAAASASMGGIQLDPCGASRFDSEVVHVKKKGKVVPITGGWFADVTLVKPGTHEGLVQSPHGGTVVCLDGLAQDWSQARSVFVNPPYDALEVWLNKCKGANTPVVALVPVRTHRPWFCAAARGALVVTLTYRVIFKGHLDAFPAPLALVCWNVDLVDLGERETGRWVVR
jgi:hypothetical protein